MFNFSLRRAGLPLFVVILGSYIFIIATLGFLFTFSIRKGAHEQHNIEVAETHVLMARNLGGRVYDYLDTHIRAASFLAGSLAPSSEASSNSLLADFLDKYPYVHSIAIYRNGSSFSDPILSVGTTPFPVDQPLDSYFDGDNEHLSGVLHNPLTNENCLLIRYPIKGDFLLIAELSISPLESLRASFSFGELGYAVIFDSFDQIVAHPNAEWASSRKNISGWRITLSQRSNHEGVDEFFSPYYNANMVAAYSTVPVFNWGVFLSQPRSEIEQHIRSVTTRQTTWFALVLLLALVMARFLAHWISRPINTLAVAARGIEDEQNACRMQISLASRSPREINQLCYSLNALLTHLRESHSRQAKYRSQIEYIADHSPLLLCVCDKQGTIVYAVGKVLSKFGYTPITAVGLPITDLFPQSSCSSHAFDRLQNGEEVVSTIHKNGTVIELWCSAIKDADDEISEHIMVVGTDVSASHIAAQNSRLLEENRQLNENLIRAEEDERRRIAGELHDLFGQDLSSIRNFTLLIKNYIKNCSFTCGDPIQEISEYISEIDRISSSLQEVIRSMLARLWPEALDNVGLVGAIQDLLEYFKKQYPGVALYAHYDFDESALSDNQSIYIYRIISECLANVGRHAEATEVAVNVSISGGDFLEILIEDNGKGFNSSLLPYDRYGIRGVKERVRSLGGVCEFKSSPGGGTVVRVTIPLGSNAS